MILIEYTKTVAPCRCGTEQPHFYLTIEYCAKQARRSQNEKYRKCTVYIRFFDSSPRSVIRGHPLTVSVLKRTQNMSPPALIPDQCPNGIRDRSGRKNKEKTLAKKKGKPQHNSYPSVPMEISQRNDPIIRFIMTAHTNSPFRTHTEAYSTNAFSAESYGHFREAPDSLARPPQRFRY